MNKKLILISVLILALAFSAAVFAQDETTPDTPPFGMMGGGMMGRGMMGGWGMMADGQHPMMDALAEALGIDTATLFTELQGGKSLLELAEEKGVTTEALQAAALGAMAKHSAELVQSGFMTQEQANAMLEWHTSNIDSFLTSMPMFSGGFGGMMHGHGWNTDGETGWNAPFGGRGHGRGARGMGRSF